MIYRKSTLYWPLEGPGFCSLDKGGEGRGGGGGWEGWVELLVVYAMLRANASVLPHHMLKKRRGVESLHVCLMACYSPKLDHVLLQVEMAAERSNMLKACYYDSKFFSGCCKPILDQMARHVPLAVALRYESTESAKSLGAKLLGMPWCNMLAHTSLTLGTVLV